MTGQELFYALSFVDERYIEEADKGRVSSGMPWKKVLSVAACLCILLAGAVAMRNLGFEKAPEAAAPPMAPMPEAAPEAAPPAPESAMVQTQENASAAIGKLHHVPYARLQVLQVLEDGSFEAVVEADEPMEMDTQVTVVVDPSKVPGADPDAYTDLISVVEGALIEIEDGAYDPEQNTLYIAKMMIVKE